MIINYFRIDCNPLLRNRPIGPISALSKRRQGNEQMTFKYTIRLQKFNKEIFERICDFALTANEVQTVGSLVGGVYFTSERDPVLMLASFQGAGFDFKDFETFEFGAN